MILKRNNFLFILIVWANLFNASQSNADLNKSYHKLPIIKYTRLELEMIEKEAKKLEEATSLSELRRSGSKQKQDKK